jgi:hypothetical protein
MTAFCGIASAPEIAWQAADAWLGFDGNHRGRGLITWTCYGNWLPGVRRTLQHTQLLKEIEKELGLAQ